LYCGRCRSGLCRLSSSCGRRHRCAVLFPYTTLFRSQMGTFLQARDCMGQLVGVIGMLGYDYRFPHLGLDERKTVEVARLFVDPAYRRTGLGTVLFEYLLRIAKREEIERLYLHTHPFLEGACE